MNFKETLQKYITRQTFFIALIPTLAIILSVIIYIYESYASPHMSGYIGIPGFKYRGFHNDNMMGIITIITALGLLLILGIKQLKPAMWTTIVKNILTGLIIVLVIFSGIIYFYGSRGVSKQHYPKFWDSYHYLLGPKYFSELGYYKLYECHLKADGEKSKPKYKNSNRTRNLRNYRYYSVGHARKRANCSTFSQKRWDEFKKDTQFFEKYTLRKVIQDHGYNGTPFHARIASIFANIPNLNYKSVTVLSFIDIIGVAIAIALIIWAFGWEIGTLFALFYFTNFADRFYYIGASYFRYMWMVCLGAGVAFLKKEKYAVSAVLLTASAMLNVFPLLFFAGIGTKTVFEFIKSRKILPQYKTFIMWAIIATVAFGSISLMQKRHIHNYKDFFNNMSQHSGLLTRSRIGFRFNFLYSGEFTRKDKKVSYREKKLIYNQNKPIIFLITGLILIFGFAVVIRLDDVKATVLGGFLLFFMLFSTVEYYYACAALLILFWHNEENIRKQLIFLMLPFAFMSIIYLIWYTHRFLPFCNNHGMTLFFTIYLGSILAVKGMETKVVQDITSLIKKYSIKLKPYVSKITESRLYSVMASHTYKIIGISAGCILLIVILVIILSETRYTLVATGDTILARRIHFHVYEKGHTYPLKDVKHIIKNADVAMTNLETVISTKGKMHPKGERSPYFFRGRPELLDIITDAGFDFVTTANNHAMDYGPEALKEQKEILTAAGIAYAGSGENIVEASRPTFIQVKDITIAFISMYIGNNPSGAEKNKPGVFRASNNREAFELLQEPYRYARERAHIVIFSPHWGYNMTRNPTRSRVHLAHQIIRMGFDAILGHSAHVLHGIEVYKGKPIIYDMGNFLADWVSGRRMKRSAIFTLEFTKQGFKRVNIIPISLYPGRVEMASRSESRKTVMMVYKASKQINRGIKMYRSGRNAYSKLYPQKKELDPKKPDSIHISNTTKPLPSSYKQIYSNAILKDRPVYTIGFTPLKLDKNIEIIGVNHVDVVHSGSCFLLEVALKVSGPIKGIWEAVIYGKSPSHMGRFQFRHPISNGATHTAFWKSDQVIEDRICVRPRNKLPKGKYDIFWTLRNRKTNQILFGEKLSPDGKNIPPKIGTIEILEKGISNKASGIDWDGKRK